MALYVIGDLHLSFSVDKPMDVFAGWENHAERIEKAWREEVADGDTVVLPGDLSWGISLEQTLADFRFVNSLPGRKIILKGNHDYWWTTLSKMNAFLKENGLDTLHILHNNHYSYGEYGICGTRGWINETKEPADAKVLAREAGRLDASVRSAVNAGLKPIVFLHYPPLYGNECNYDILDVIGRYDVKYCYYGHLHGASKRHAVIGERDGVYYQLISCDFIQFCPYRIL